MCFCQKRLSYRHLHLNFGLKSCKKTNLVKTNSYSKHTFFCNYYIWGNLYKQEKTDSISNYTLYSGVLIGASPVVSPTGCTKKVSTSWLQVRYIPPYLVHHQSWVSTDTVRPHCTLHTYQNMFCGCCFRWYNDWVYRLHNTELGFPFKKQKDQFNKVKVFCEHFFFT